VNPPAPKFFNTLTRTAEPLPVPVGQPVKIYTCGPTVYNYAHIGNFRAYVFEDLLQRYLQALGHTVDRVMNFTDVDDKTIRSSRAENLPLASFTAKYKAAFLEDLAALNILVPAKMPCATDHIAEVIAMIQDLVAKDVAYRADDGSVYYRIGSFANYGKLAHLNLDELRPGARVNQDEYEKESLGDFALWKARSEADGDVFWDSPWGPGRPGWHIECSAMACKHLGTTMDIHCGGVDNIFPHHEAEIAQSEAVTGKPFVKLWMHCAHLKVEGDKMSKSAGNFFTLRDLTTRGYTGREIRFTLLKVHYRLELNFTFAELEASKDNLARIDAWVARLRDAAGSVVAAEPAAFARAFLVALGDDLNISKALAVLFDIIRDTNRTLDAGTLSRESAASLLAAWETMNHVLGITPPVLDVPSGVAQLVDDRKAARAAKDFRKSDELRDAIKALGWQVKDTPKGQELTKL
jgi:cysteinyl-tRNA synthetase